MYPSSTTNFSNKKNIYTLPPDDLMVSDQDSIVSGNKKHDKPIYIEQNNTTS